VLLEIFFYSHKSFVLIKIWEMENKVGIWDATFVLIDGLWYM